MNDRRRRFVLAAGLVMLVGATFAGLADNGFVNFDDDAYLTDNPWTRDGLTARGAAWALTTTRTGNWHPLTWISHMLDVELFGMDAGAHHLVSLAFHAANGALLFALLASLTGRLWPPALAAALFAVHPLHVESVAWAAERKDVLSTLFALLTLLAYARAARRGLPGRSAAVPALFALALTAKPMPVSLPFLMLLLDWWPLGRWSPNAGALAGAGRRLLPPARLWTEKLPIFILAVVSAAVTLHAQGGAIVTLDRLPFGTRAAGALVAYAGYLAKAALPRDLSVFYPLRWSGPFAPAIAGAALLIAAVTAASAAVARRLPWVAVGWLWYLGSLVPVIGLLQVGAQAMADRYTYLPLTGIFIALAWSLAALARVRPALRRGLAGLSCLAVLACAAATAGQVRLWRSGESLFRHAVMVTPESWVAWYNLGSAQLAAGNPAAAAASYRRAENLDPGRSEVRTNLGRALEVLGDRASAIEEYRTALRLDPGNAVAHLNLGATLAASERLDLALPHFEAAVRGRPENADARFNLGRALVLLGRTAAGVPHLREAVRLDPADREARALLETAAGGR